MTGIRIVKWISAAALLLLPGARLAAQVPVDTVRTSDKGVVIVLMEDNSWKLLKADGGRYAEADDKTASTILDRLYPGRSHDIIGEQERRVRSTKGILKSTGGEAATEKVESFLPENTEPVYYKIRKGDTLSGIARRYGTTVKSLCSLNGIKETTILSIGRTLRVK